MNVLPEMAEYMYDLPPELVAQAPPPERGQSRLLVLDRRVDTVFFHQFQELPDLLPPNALLVFNEVRVSLARLLGRRMDTGGQAEAFILEPPSPAAGAGAYDLWCLVHPGRRVKPGADFFFPAGEGLFDFGCGFGVRCTHEKRDSPGRNPRRWWP